MAKTLIYGLVQTIIENLGPRFYKRLEKYAMLKTSLKNFGKQFLESNLYLRMQRSNKVVAI